MSGNLLVVPMLLAAGVMGLVLLDALIRRPVLGAALVWIAAILSSALVTNIPRFSGLGPTIYPGDIVAALIVTAAVARLLRMPPRRILQRLVLVIGAVILWSLLRGFVVFDLQAAVAEVRGNLQLFGSALYLSTFEYSDELWDRLTRVWLAGAAAFSGLVLVRWAARFGGLNIGMLDAQYDAPIRVLSGQETFLLAQAFFLTVPLWRRDPPFDKVWAKWASAALFVMVVLLNRRTVWVTLIVGITVMILRGRTLSRRASVALILGAAVCAVVVLNLPGEFSEEEQFAQDPTDTSTLWWRVEGWTELLTSGPDDLQEWVFGQPYGSTFTRDVSTGTVDSGPHNFYLHMLLRTGVVGALVFVALYGVALRKVHRIVTVKHRLLSSEVLFTILAMQLVWYLTWSAPADAGLIIGMTTMLVGAAGDRAHAGHVSARPAARQLVTG